MATVEIRELVKPETGEKFYPYAHLNGVKGAELLPRIGTSVQTTQPVPIFQVKDALNAQFYPQTHAEAVIGLAQMIESNQFFVKESDGNGGFRIKLKDEFTGFYANGWAAAGGIGSGGGGGGGGLISTVYGESSLGTIYSAGGSESLTATFSAFAIDKIWQSVLALQQSTPNVSLTNGQDYSSITVNGTTSVFYTKSQVDGLISGIHSFEPVPVQTLPTASADTMYKLYLVPSEDPQSQNIKDEYITYRTGSAGNYTYTWEKVGSTAIDLSGYVTLGTAQTITGAKTFSGGITMSGADIVPGADSTCNIGTSSKRFSDGSIRNLHVTTFDFRDGSSPSTQIGGIYCGGDIMQLQLGSGSANGYYNFGSSTGVFHSGNGTVPCGRSDHRWSKVWSVDADLTGDIALASTSHIDIGPVRIEYHSSTDSLHITTNDATNHPNIGFWVDGFNSAGGYGSNGGGGGGLITSVYGVSDLGSVYSIGGTEDFTKTFSAFAIDKVWQTLVSLQNSTPDVSLTNGSSYSTLWVNNTSVIFYTKSQVDSLLGGIHAFDYVTASSLPTAGVDTMYKIYLVPSADPQTLNVKDEYITVRSGSSGSYSYSWEQIGSTAVDLSGYVTTTALGNWTGSTNITTLGTISTGTWSGTAIGATKGGTGLTAITKGAILYASAANTISALSANGTSTKKFLSQTSSNAPSWGTISLTDISGTSDLQAIEDLSGTSGLLKKTAANTWTLDTTSYLSSHQTIYKLTLNAGSFTAGEYTPNSEAKLFNIPTTLDHISDGTTRKLANYLPIAGGTLTGDLRLKDNRNYGMTLRFGDGDYCYLNEDDDDHLLIYGSRGISIVAGSGYGVVISDYIEIGNARLTYDSSTNALHITRGDGGAGVVGLYIDGFLSSGGAAGQSNVPDELNYAGRLYIQHNSNDLCLTTGGKTIIGSYPGSSAIGSNKFYVAGSSIGSAWNTSSDARLKENIEIVGKDEAVATIMRLNPVTWTWNERSELNGKRSAGLIAQQVESVIPYMVTGDEYKGLNYTMLHAFEIGAIQSHEDRIKILEGRVKSLNEEIERLRAS